MLFVAAGESVSSDTSLGCGADVDIALVAWQAAEDDPEAGAAAGMCADPAAPRWLQLSPSQEPANLTGTAGPGLGMSSPLSPKEELGLFAWLIRHQVPFIVPIRNCFAHPGLKEFGSSIYLPINDDPESHRPAENSWASYGAGALLPGWAVVAGHSRACPSVQVQYTNFCFK